MYGCDITSKAVEQLSEALAQNTSLEKLDIGCNKLIGDEGIRHIAEALKQSKQLKELWISGCGMTDKGANYLARALSVNNTLKMLHMGVSSGQVTEKGCLELMQSLSHNTTLIKLVIPERSSLTCGHLMEKLNEVREKIGLPCIEIEREYLRLL